MSLQVRLFNDAATAYRVLPAKVVASGTQWRISRMQGYADAKLTLYGRPDNGALTGLLKRRRVEFWVQGKRAYRGYIERIQPGVDRPRTVTVTLYGRFLHAGRFRTKKRYASDSGIDLGSLFADLANKFVLPGMPGISIDSRIIDSTLDSFDAYGTDFETAVNALLDAAGGLVVAGCDIDPNTGGDRLFFRPFGSAGAPEHTVAVPSRSTGPRETDSETTQQVNTLNLVGGAARWPNLLADAVNGNTSFEVPQFAGEGVGNLLTNGDFERVRGVDGVGLPTVGALTGWTTANGASVKSNGLTEGNVFSGLDMIELDNPTEIVFQSVNPKSGVFPGDTYLLRIQARRENGNFAATANLRLKWLDNGGSTLQTDTLLMEPDSVIWRPSSLTSVAPTGATGYRVEVECVSASASGKGIMVDAAEFYDRSLIRQVGWDIVTGGAGALNAVNWTYEADSAHGAYSVYIDATASDTDADDVSLEALGQSRFSVTPNQVLRFTARVKRPPGVATHPKVLLRLGFFNQDGSQVDEDDDDPSHQYPAGSDWTDWTVIQNTATVPSDAVTCRLRFLIRGTGTLLIDGLCVRDQAAPVEEFIEAGTYEVTLDVRDCFAPGDAEYDAHVVGGAIPEVLEATENVDAITTYPDALEYATAYLRKHALPVDRKRITLYQLLDCWPGQYVRAIGPDRAEFLPSALSIAEITGEWDGKLTQVLYLETERQTEARALRDIIRRELRSSGAIASTGAFGAGGGFSASSSSGGSGGSGGATAPALVKITSADTTPDYLDGKVGVASGRLTKAIASPGGDETLTLDLETTGVTPNTFTVITSITFDAYGRITAISGT